MRRNYAIVRNRYVDGYPSFVLVPKRGHRTRLDPVEGSEASDHGPVEGPHSKGLEPSFRVNVTSADNMTGSESHGSRNRMHSCVHVRICGSPGWVTAQGHPAHFLSPFFPLTGASSILDQCGAPRISHREHHHEKS